MIQDYHKHDPTVDLHISDLTPLGQSHCNINDPRCLIKSSRIRVGRNIKGLPLGPGVTKEQRLEIMRAVMGICESFEGDLAGSFYSLEGMDPSVQKKLIEDHFLFK